MDRVWLVGLVVLGACSFDATGIGRGPGQTSQATTSSGTETTTGGPEPTTLPTSQASDDSGTATTLDVTITGSSSSSSSSGPGTATSTGTSVGTETDTSGTDTSAGTQTSGDSSSGDSSGTTVEVSSSSGEGSSSTGEGSSSTGEPVSCVDGVLNGAESDIDCGGPECPACGVGEQCGADEDCSTLVCELGACLAAACDDGVANGAETDVDCGGPVCVGCGVGLGCGVDDDCVSGICGPDLCVATTCENFKQDGLETGIDCGGGCPACVGPIINEVDYDQDFADDAEFVELYNPGPAPIALAGLQLVLVNGATKTPYTTIELGPAGVLLPGGFLVVRSPGLVVAPGALTLDFALAVGNIQNGSPDGVAVIHALQPALLDALSYEGAITDADIPPLGVVSLVEGMATPAEDDGVGVTAMIRLPDGLDTDDAFNDWQLSGTPTPGAPNVP